ncbi:SDR family oxidoreductase [Dongia sedimenti]|uniref:SDR family oxidoreductase n=1 Tax=Dongia sedimenti TaxID=3064282 RepID=A0ABU0YPH9_9PROT|nr:SDR family oxidoreductase [Rhodospirillaceae bacterium R-7]
MTQQPHLFCFGLGYTAMALAGALAERGWRVTGTCRDPSHAEAARRRGLEIVIFDRDHPIAEIDRHLADATHLLSSVPPDERGDPVLDLHGAAIARAAPRLQWIGYLSTTGVYGDRNGDWVDESSALTPSGERGRRRVAAETAWRGLPLPAHLFRLAGIYGPGRSALDTVRSGKARRVLKPGQVFSRIHRDDIVQVLLASIAQPHAGAAYNVCDDDAADPAEVISYACKLLNVAPPPAVPFAEAQLSPMARSFYDDNKRVRNDRIKRELGVVLKYPNYRTGLNALLAAES